MSDANEGAPTLREVLETVECEVFLEVVDLPPGGKRREKIRTATIVNGPTLVDKLVHSRILPDTAALLACRPTLRVDSDVDGRSVIAASVAPFGTDTEGQA